MPIPTAPALLVGLGARILLNAVFRPGAEPSIPDSVLLGVWQGVGLQYAGKQHIQAAIAVGAAIFLKLSYDYTLSPDFNRSLTTLIGVLLGVAGTELLASYVDQSFEDEPVEPRRRTRSLPSRYLPHVSGHHVPKPKSERTVQFRPSVQGGSTESVRPAHTLISDITSMDSAFELVNRPVASPIEREIAALRARASLADSERRRYKEERKWALSQGNVARAEQMKSEYKRYKALMESCHREADLKLLAMEAAKERAERNPHPNDRYAFPREESPPPERSSKHSRSSREVSINGSASQPSPSRNRDDRAPPQLRIPSNGGVSSQPSPSYREFKAAQEQRRASAAAARLAKESRR